jgi:methylated-DNA-[protein]-cysteine S-methyltransferase
VTTVKRARSRNARRERSHSTAAAGRAMIDDEERAMTSLTWDIHMSALGPLTLTIGPDGLRGLWFPGRAPAVDEARRDEAALAPAVAQLEEYLAGERDRFELDLDLRGTPFQRSVWDALREIPYGSTVSYSELARTIGRPDVVRAVGAAVGRTPVPIIVPCHRVVGADGSLTGYGGGLHRKRALLDLEAGSGAIEVDGRQMALL